MKKKRIYYDVVKTSSLGDILVAATELGLLRTFFPLGRKQPRKLLSETAPEAEVIRDRAKLKDAVRQLKEYLRGGRKTFKVRFDLGNETPFRHRVLRNASRIPYGETITYGELARSCGCPGGARAIGQAMARNPLPIIIPCHRVLASDGKLGGYSGGLKYKKMLLNLEGVEV